MSQEEGSVSKEKQEEFEKDRKRAIKEMIDSRKFYIPHKKLNEKISVKAFSQEGEEEMVVFDEIRLDQGPTPRSIEKRLSIKDFYNTYVTFSRKAKVDGSQGESLNEDLDKDLSDVLLQGEIDQLEQEKKVLEKTSTSFEGIGKKMKELARIKDEIERLQNKRDELCGTSTRSATIEEFKRKIKEMEVIDERMAVLKSGNVGVEIEESKEVIEKDAFTLKESLEKIQSLDELITFIEGNENGVQQYIKQETENKPSVEALRYLRNILGDDSLSPDEKTRRCAEELRKETSFPKITNEVGLFKRTKELIQNVLKEERKRLEGDANVDAKTFKNEEESETIPEVEEFKEVKEEIQGVQSFEEIYEILGKYKDNISGDIDTGMSYEDVFGQIQNAYEGFKSSAKDNFIDRNHLVIPQTLPKVIFFKDEEIILSHTFWRNIFTAELDRIQKESVDRENVLNPGQGDGLIENRESLEKSELEQGIQKAESLEDLIVILDSHQGEIADGEKAYSKEDIAGKITALSTFIAMQGLDAPKPSENEQYQSDFFDHIPQTLQKTVKKLADKMWEEKHSNAGESAEEGDRKKNEEEQKEKSELEKGIQNAQSLDELLNFIEENSEKIQFYIKQSDGKKREGDPDYEMKSDDYTKAQLKKIILRIKTIIEDASYVKKILFINNNLQYITNTLDLRDKVSDLTFEALDKMGWKEGVEEKDEEGEKSDPEGVRGDYEEIKPGHNLIPASSAKEMMAKEKDGEGDFLRELTKELDDARREYAQDIYNGEKKNRYNDVLLRYNTEVSSRFGEFIGEKEFEQMVRANEIQEQLAIKDIRAEHLIEKAPLWEKGKSFLKDRVNQWKALSLKQKVLVSASIVGVGGAGILTGSAVLGAGALVAGTAVRAVSFAATSSGFKGILESYSEKLYEGAERERMEQARSLFRENEYGSDSQEQRIYNITRLLAQSAEKQANRARKRRLERHARTAVALASALTLVMASRCLGQTAVDTLEGYFGGPLEGSGGITEPQGRIDIGIEKEPIAYDKDYIFPDVPPQEPEPLPQIKTIEVPIERTPEEYIQAHPEMFREISGRVWMDNNTSLQVGVDGKITGADLNELNLHWGGGGDGIDANGNYVFDIAKMTEDGSFHKNLSVDARDAIQRGDLKMLFTLDGDTQSYGIEIPVRPDGSVVIDPQSPEGKLLFQTVGEGVDTKLEFKGKFAEVGVIGEDGKFTVLATHKGVGLESITDVVQKEITVPPQIEQEIPPVEQVVDPIEGGGETTIPSEDVVIEDKQEEILPPITTEPTVPEEPVVPLGKEPSLERVIIGPGEVAVLGLAGMGARKIHKGRGRIDQSMIATPIRKPEVDSSPAPLELEAKKDEERIVASLRDYKEYEKGLSPEKKREIEKTAQRLQELSNKTEQELKSMPAEQFSTLAIGEKIKNRTSVVVASKIRGENQDIEKLIREEMTDPKEGENAYDYIRRNIIQPMVLTREYK